MSITSELFDEAYNGYRDISVRYMAKTIGVPHATLSLNVRGHHAFKAETWIKMMALLGFARVEKGGILIQTNNDKALNAIDELANMPLMER